MSTDPRTAVGHSSSALRRHRNHVPLVESSSGHARHRESLRTFLDIFVAPRRAFDAIQADLPVRTPLLVLVGAAVLVNLALAAKVDTHGFVDLMHTDMPEPRPERDLIASVANTLVAALPAMAAVYILMTLLAFGFCLWILGKLLKDSSTFRASMSLACWASLPGLIHSLAALVSILLAQPDPSPLQEVILLEHTAPLNLGMLGVDQAFLGGVPTFYSLTDFWIAALVALGYQRWYQTHIAQAVAVAIIPFALLAILMLWNPSVGPPVATEASPPAATATESPFPTP